jgi:poly(A) polymerase
MREPVVVPRDQHAISRKQIDPDALKVLYRLHQNEHVAYLVGGSVRDLLLGRRPKDFDIGTSAHPYQVKRLFKNCWIIGRRFRLAHVRFGPKTIEVATFRRQLSAQELAAADEQPPGIPVGDVPGEDADARSHADRLLHRDNPFGTPEEDAFRRDFTINALFYDIGSFSIIDYTGGLQDLQEGVVRSIGDPIERFQEDPVRMLRAVAMAARLGFRIDPPIDDAIATNRSDIARSAPARLMEELYKLLRSGSAERAFRMLAERRLLEPIAQDLQRGATDRLWESLAALDAYRRRFDDAPDTLTNAVLLGSLLVPLGHAFRSSPPPRETENPAKAGLHGNTKAGLHGNIKAGLSADAKGRLHREKEPRLTLGMLPLARRDVERLRQILGLQRRLIDMGLSPRARRGLMHRGPFRDALTWLEIHGQVPEVVEHWRGFIEAAASYEGEPDAADAPRRRRRRRRRRSFRPAPQ